jgi:hypothetical protein
MITAEGFTFEPNEQETLIILHREGWPVVVNLDI